MGIPACLWRRTGEIYKGNKEFASLVNVPIETLREVWYGGIFVLLFIITDFYLQQGRLCIYELMAEDAMVNYWEVTHRTLVFPKVYKDGDCADLFMVDRNMAISHSILVKRLCWHLVYSRIKVLLLNHHSYPAVFHLRFEETSIIYL